MTKKEPFYNGLWIFVVLKVIKSREITASTFLTGHLSKYDVVYMYPSQHETEYVIVDLLDDPTLMLIELENKGYTNIFKCNEIDIYQKLTR